MVAGSSEPDTVQMSLLILAMHPACSGVLLFPTSGSFCLIVVKLI